ncbi:O-antigen ligase family protein [Anaerolineales bacterium HSG6]|nr:O-antigen ligase family protein [Anaerolineales bacterium HSG6]MDM8531879.1 O-antigen ligase family protein [Anaerolineales bacterium HSG25]
MINFTLSRRKISVHFWRVQLLIFLIALTVGPILAVLVVQGQSLYAVALIIFLPVAVLMNRYPFTAFMIWCIFIPLVPAKPEYRYLYWVFHRSLIPLAVGVNILSRMLKIQEHKPVRIGWPDLAMAAYLVFGLITIVTNNDFLENRKVVFALYDRIFIAFCAYWLVRFLQPTDKELERLVSVLLFLLILEGVVVLTSWFFPGFIPRTWIAEGRLEGLRGTGTFREPAPLTSAVIFCSTFVLQSIMIRQKGLKKLFYMSSLGLAGISIIFSFSRGSWVSALIVLVIWILLYGRTILPFIITSILIAVLLFSTVFGNELNYALSRLNSAQTAGSRLVLANAGQRMFYEKPIFGWGYGSYDLHDWKFMERVGDYVPRQYEIKQGTSHNTYLTILAETGIIGFSLYVFPYVWWLIMTVVIWPRLPRGQPSMEFFDWRFFMMLWACLWFIITVSQFVDARFFWFTIGTQWFTLGLIANFIDRYLNSDEMTMPRWLRNRSDI